MPDNKKLEIRDTFKINRSKGIIQELPINQQPVILDEVFAAYMQGPLSKKFDKFLLPKELEMNRQQEVKKWWKGIRKQAEQNKAGNLKILKNLNKDSDIPTTSLKAFTIGGFVDAIQGKEIDQRGRFSIADTNTQKLVEEKNKLGDNNKLRREVNLPSMWS